MTERKEIFNDVLNTTQRSTAELAVDSTPDATLDLVTISFFNNPAYSRTKPPQSNATYGVPRAKKREKKRAEEFEVQQLLALAELRYLEDIQKLQSAITRSKRMQTMALVGTLATLRPHIHSSFSILQRTYLLKWRHRVREAVRRDPHVRVVKLTYSLALLGQVSQRLLQKSFCIFYERGLTSAVRRRLQPRAMKLSKFVPPPAAVVSNRQLLASIGLNTSEVHSRKIERLDEETKREFKKAMKQRRYQERGLHAPQD